MAAQPPVLVRKYQSSGGMYFGRSTVCVSTVHFKGSINTLGVKPEPPALLSEALFIPTSLACSPDRASICILELTSQPMAFIALLSLSRFATEGPAGCQRCCLGPGLCPVALSTVTDICGTAPQRTSMCLSADRWSSSVADCGGRQALRVLSRDLEMLPYSGVC